MNHCIKYVVLTESNIQQIYIIIYLFNYYKPH